MKSQHLCVGARWLLFAGLLLALAVPPPARGGTTDVKALQGTWTGWVVEGKGEKPDAGPVQLRLEIKGNVIVATRLGGQKESPLGEGTFTLSLAEGNKIIDATRTSNPGKGQTYLGIYSVDGNIFRWCSATPGKDRPRDLETRRGQFLMVLKRQGR